MIQYEKDYLKSHKKLYKPTQTQTQTQTLPLCEKDQIFCTTSFFCIKEKNLSIYTTFNFTAMSDFLWSGHRNCCELFENLDGHVQVILSYISID